MSRDINETSETACKAQREPTFEELGLEQKVDRLRVLLKEEIRRSQRFQFQLSMLMLHEHGVRGNVVYPHMYENDDYYEKHLDHIL